MRPPPGTSEWEIAEQLDRFKIETPSWGYADTGTRFGKFLQDSAATTIYEKIADAAHVNAVTGCCPTIAVHVLWDFLDGVSAAEIASIAESQGIRIGSINPNLFQDQCFKLGSVTNADPAIRQLAIDHMLLSVKIGQITGSNLLSLWFADGTNYPGQANLRQRKRWMEEALVRVHDAMPESMTMLVEYKPFEPAFYHTDIADWGMAYVFAKAAGPRARVLVDTGHHLHGTNIEHIVSFLTAEGMLGGFHFNDRKYADDDLEMGSIDPYQLFRIFAEITQAEAQTPGSAANIAYMIDQSHNLKPKVEAMIQSVMTAQEHYAKALLVDWKEIERAQQAGDIIAAETALRDAFSTDVRGFLKEYRQERGLPADPLAAHRESGYAAQTAAERGPRKKSSGSSYA